MMRFSQDACHFVVFVMRRLILSRPNWFVSASRDGQEDHQHSSHVTFHKLGIGGQNEDTNNRLKLRTLNTIRSMLGHENVSSSQNASFVCFTNAMLSVQNEPVCLTTSRTYLFHRGSSRARGKLAKNIEGEKNQYQIPTVCMNGLTVTCRVAVVSKSIFRLLGRELPWLSSTSKTVDHKRL